MSDDFYDDDFHSDGGRSPRRSPSPHSRSPSPRAGSPSPRGGSNLTGLMPIVEVPTPSESNTVNGSPRSDDEKLDTDRTNNTEDCSDDESDEEEASPRTNRPSSARRQKNRHNKVRNGRFNIDMTPPDKLLKRAERKTARYAEKHKVDRAIKELIRCTALARILYGDGHWKLAKAYVNLAKGYFDLKGYAPQAQQHADFAKSIMMSGVQMSDSSGDKPAIMEVLVEIYYTLGRASTLMKKYPEAEQALNKADKISRERAKLSSVKSRESEDWKIKMCLSMARLNVRHQKYALATTNFEKALDLMERKHGEDHIDLIPIYQSLGKVEQCKGVHADHEKAIDHYLQAHSIASANYKDNDVHIAETARALASAYSAVNDIEAETSAESYLNECLGIYQAVYGPHDERTVDTEDELARLMIRTDRQDEGLSLLRSGLDAKKEVYGELSAEVAATWKLMANVYLAKHDSEKALRALKKGHNIECALYGTNHRKSKDTQRTIDLLMANPSLASKQKKTKAEEMKDRPRFNSIVSRSKPMGSCKVPDS